MNIILDKERQLSITYEVLEAIEDMGVDMRKLTSNLPMKVITGILCASLSVEDDTLTHASVGAMIFKYSNKVKALEAALYVMTNLIPFYTGMTMEEFDKLVAEKEAEAKTKGEEEKNDQNQSALE